MNKMMMYLDPAALERTVARAVVISPILQIIVLSFGVLISFLVSYFKGDVTIYVPFISETGAIVPEMGIFSTTLIFGSLLGAIVVLYRYKVASKILPENCILGHRVNVLAVVLGEISMAGLAGVAAFPMSTVLIAHLIAAGIHFTLAMVYLFLQTYISMKTEPLYYSRYITIVRGVLAVVLLIFLLLLVICLPIAYVQWRKKHPGKRKAMKVPGDEVFEVLLASALFEWLYYITFLTFTFTFTNEFKKFTPSFTVQSVSDSTKVEKNDNGLPANAE